MPQIFRAHDEVSDVTLLSVAPLSCGDDIVAEEGDNFLTVEEILPRNPMSRNDFHKEHAPSPVPVISETGPSQINELQSTYCIPPHVEIVSDKGDIVEVHGPGYCAFYVYHFVIGHTLPLLLLAEEFYRFYKVCPA